MKRITESQLRQIVREEILNEIKFDLGGGSAMRTPEERKQEFAGLWSYDPNAPIVDPKFRSNRPVGLRFVPYKFFIVIKNLIHNEAKKRNIEDYKKDRLTIDLYGQEIFDLLTKYDALSRIQKERYNNPQGNAYFIKNENKIRIPDPDNAEEFIDIEITDKNLQQEIEKLTKEGSLSQPEITPEPSQQQTQQPNIVQRLKGRIGL